MVTISLCILVVSLFLLLFQNLGRIMDGWGSEGRAMVYLAPGFTVDMQSEVESALLEMEGISRVFFVSKDQALDRLKRDGRFQPVLDSLKDNPLPHAVEIQIQTRVDFDQVADLVENIESLPMVTDVEYGREWLVRFLHLFHLFQMTGYVMGVLFLLIAFFITASTVRLVFHARQPEVEIMRLVGATDRFIKMPFYVTGLIQGSVGGILGLLILYMAYLVMGLGISRIMGDLIEVNVRFLSFGAMTGLLGISSFLGWFGCYLSLKRLLK